MKKDAIFDVLRAVVTSGQRGRLDFPPAAFRAVRDKLRNREGRALAEQVEFFPDRQNACIWVDRVEGVQPEKTIAAAFKAMTTGVGGDLDRAVRDFYENAVRDGYFETSEPINSRRCRDALEAWNLEYGTDISFRRSTGRGCFYRKSGGDFYRQRARWALSEK